MNEKRSILFLSVCKGNWNVQWACIRVVVNLLRYWCYEIIAQSMCYQINGSRCAVLQLLRVNMRYYYASFPPFYTTRPKSICGCKHFWNMDGVILKLSAWSRSFLMLMMDIIHVGQTLLWPKILLKLAQYILNTWTN